MTGLMTSVDQRTKLAGENRLELLLFGLGESKNVYGINVFKVREVIVLPRIYDVPHKHEHVIGVIEHRGKPIPVINVARAIGAGTSTKSSHVIVTEFNRSVQGFVVPNIDQIINLKWEDVSPPTHDYDHCLTAVAEHDGKQVMILDVEKILSNITPVSEEVSDNTIEDSSADISKCRILVADDSTVALKQVTRALDQVNIKYVTAKNGEEAFEILQHENVDLVLSDIEMPTMDGYTLTKQIRADDKLQHLRVILHSSMSGKSNDVMSQTVGASCFIAKYDPDELITTVIRELGKVQQ